MKLYVIEWKHKDQRGGWQSYCAARAFTTKKAARLEIKDLSTGIDHRIVIYRREQ